MIGTLLNNRYKIEGRLGQGAMGDVYRATDTQSGQAVALKILARQLTLDAEMVERFRREGEALRQLRHPNIVSFVDMFEHEGQHMIVMEYVPGGSLHALLKREGPLPIERARQIAIDLCDALIRAHRLGITHRDIKPENVLIADDGAPRLTDFGVARLSEGSRLTGTGTQVGTPYYMSPEAWEGKPLDAQTDIWSLGIVLYEMLSGEVPFGGETLVAVMNKVLTALLPELKTKRADVPEGLADIVERMLARNKAARYQTMREVAADMERGQPTHPLPRAATTVTASVPASAKPASRLPAMIGLGLVLALAISAVWLVTQFQRAQTTAQAAGSAATYDLDALATEFANATATQKADNNATQKANSTEVRQTVNAQQTNAALTPSKIPTSTRTPGPTSTPNPLELGESLVMCNDDLCIVSSGGSSQQLGLREDYEIPFPDGTSWSPDGTRFVFSACLRSTVVAGECNPDLFLVNRDGSNIISLVTNSNSHDTMPAWSPDGQWIAYNNNGGVAIIRPDGTGKTGLVKGGSLCPGGIGWSPDSQQIAFLGGDGSCAGVVNNDSVWVISSDGTNMRRILQGGDPQLVVMTIAWSPDGQSVMVMQENGNALLLDADCPNLPTGCDESSRTKQDSFPEDWLPTFHPQWISAYADPKAAAYGCGINDQLLYAEDFENSDTANQIGPWKVEEVSGGGRALHARNPDSENAYGTYPLSNDVATERRITFRVMPILPTWGMQFREGDNGQAHVRYDISVQGGTLTLRLWKDEAWFNLAATAAPQRLEWTTVDVIWEQDHTIVVRLDKTEVIRYVESGGVIEQGKITLLLYGRNTEAWFDDIVVCGQQ